ncbi:BCCT family transporter [Macrococcus sp. PK]|uniref:BCCT family transporter n=1 Tax=Macrococcus sp. PK TaxID=2801919 RepID=UPI0037C62D07
MLGDIHRNYRIVHDDLPKYLKSDFAVHNDVFRYPKAVAAPPVSNNEIPWATRNEHNESKQSSNSRLPITKIYDIALEDGLKKPFSISVPMDDKGTYVLSKAAGTGVTGLDNSPFKEKTVISTESTTIWTIYMGLCSNAGRVKIIRGLLLSSIAFVLLLSSGGQGLGALQSAAIISAFPFSLIIILMLI